MRKALSLVAVALAGLVCAVAGLGQTRSLACPSTDLPSTGGPTVSKDGAWATYVRCSYSDGLYGYELSLLYYPKETPPDYVKQSRGLDSHLCTSYENPPYKAYSSSVLAHVQVGGNPKSWDAAFQYAKAFLPQAGSVAYSCSTPAPGTTTTGTGHDRRGCPGSKEVVKRSEEATYSWSFSFKGVPQNVTLAGGSTSSGAGSGNARSFYCFFSDGDNREVRHGTGAGAVHFQVHTPPSSVTFSLGISGSPREHVSGKTVSLSLTGRITRVQGSNCKTGPTNVVLVDGSPDSVSVRLCGTTLRYVNGHGARVSVSIGH